MKKTIFLLVLIIGFGSGLFCQSSDPIDLVVVLDTSASMSSSYRETSNYLTGPFLREFLRIGDTFHLISFSESPKLELSRRIEGVGDVETIIARILLLYPLVPESNLSSALSFSEGYSSTLPGSRGKKIVLLTDGDAPNTQTLVDAAQTRLRSRGTDLHYIKVPVIGNGPSSGRPQAQTTTQTAQAVSGSQTGQTSTGTAGQSGQPASGQTATGQSGTTASGQTSSQTEGSTATSSQTGSPQTTGQSGGTPSGQSGTSQSGTQGTSQQVPGPGQGQSSDPFAQQTSSGSLAGGLSDLPLPLIIALGLLGLLILGLIIFFVARRLQNSPNRVIAQASGNSDPSELMGSYAEAQRKQARPPLEQPAAQRKPMPKDQIYNEADYSASNGPIMLNLFVADQNTAIGKRNIHTVKSGYTFSVGGGKSDFLIFLVPVPPHIADVRYDGRNCTFIPRSPKYFPDLGSQQVSNCIGKTIRVISDKNYEMFLRVERYEDPLAVLNRMLHSVSIPGPPQR